MDPTELLISAEELFDALDDPLLRVIDCRFSLTDPNEGRLAYQTGHIPKAQYVGLEPVLSDPAGAGGRHPLPDPNRFAKTLGNLGIGNNSTIVAYDDGGCIYACRFWWMVRWLGYADVRVLDGGLYQWVENGLPITQEVAEFTPADFKRSKPLTRQVGANELMSQDALIFDARAQERFDGKVEPLDHKAGHIPGAFCYPFEANQTAEKRFVRDSDRFAEVAPDQDVICYCGSGVSATHNIMALLLAGVKEPILYPGSWSEWIEDPERPIATSL